MSEGAKAETASPAKKAKKAKMAVPQSPDEEWPEGTIDR